MSPLLALEPHNNLLFLSFVMKYMPHASQPGSQLFTPQSLHSSHRLLCHLASPSTHQESASMHKALFFLRDTCPDDTRALEKISVGHPFEVACLLATQFKPETQAIVSALLHEMIVEKQVPLATIQREFGDGVSTIVAGVTQLVRAAYLGQACLLVRLKEVLSRPTFSHIHILLVSIADCLENLYRINSFSSNEQQRWSDLAEYVYAPLAGRLGMYHIQSELEDLYLKFRKRTTYDKIAKHIQATRSTTEGFLSSFIAPIHLALRQQGVVHTIQARTKSVSSIYRKIRKRHASLAAMHDLYAIRIVFDSRLHSEYTTCWLVHELVSTLYTTLPNKFRNWLDYPKASGYEALHLTVMAQAGQVIEVQIRSKRMDAVAEEGTAAHWKYKELAIAKEFAKIDGLWLSNAKQFLRTPSMDRTIYIRTDSAYIKR
ncbi:MAG: HD domain-containing protein [Bacteroidota bacterium]